MKKTMKMSKVALKKEEACKNDWDLLTVAMDQLIRHLWCWVDISRWWWCPLVADKIKVLRQRGSQLSLERMKICWLAINSLWWLKLLLWEVRIKIWVKCQKEPGPKLEIVCRLINRLLNKNQHFSQLKALVMLHPTSKRQLMHQRARVLLAETEEV